MILASTLLVFRLFSFPLQWRLLEIFHRTEAIGSQVESNECNWHTHTHPNSHTDRQTGREFYPRTLLSWPDSFGSFFKQCQTVDAIDLSVRLMFSMWTLLPPPVAVGNPFLVFLLQSMCFPWQAFFLCAFLLIPRLSTYPDTDCISRSKCRAWTKRRKTLQQKRKFPTRQSLLPSLSYLNCICTRLQPKRQYFASLLSVFRDNRKSANL